MKPKPNDVAEGEPLTRFNGTKNWRARQKLSTKVGRFLEAAQCVDYTNDKHLYAWEDFEFSLHKAHAELASLMKFYYQRK